MSSIPTIVRTRTPVPMPVPTPVPAKVLSLRSQVMPDRMIKVKRTDGIAQPLLREDLLFLARTHFTEGRVQHFCSYATGEPARYDAVLEPLRPSDG